MVKVLRSSEEERTLSKKIRIVDDVMHKLREKIRVGDQLMDEDLEVAI
jgi:hypothetical protein